MADRTGQTIGEYTLHEPLGTDRYGTRYRATATATGDDATVRLIPPPTSDDRWFADRVASTLRRYIGVASPHLAELLAVGEARGMVYTVGPPLVGVPLRSRLGAPLPPADVAALLGPIAAALDTLHGRYLIHGDLRPETIILTADGPVLTDTGLAPAIAAATRLAAGSRPAPSPDEAIYRAPETLTGGLSDARADLYSLAVIVYEALTGQPPFRPESTGNPATTPPGQRGTTPPAAPRERSPALSVAANDLLLRALATSPYRRPASAGELLAALGPARGTSATIIPTAPSPRPAQATQSDDRDSPSRPQASAFTAPAPLAAPAWTTPTLDTPTAPPLAPAPTASPPTSFSRPAPEIAASEATGPRQAFPPVPRGADPDGGQPRDARGGVSAAYTYTSPPSFDAVAIPGDTARQLVAGRARLVNTLAALARQRAAPPLTAERQHLIGTLRAVTAAAATPDERARPAAPLTRRAQQAPRRPAPAERAERYVDNWREVYSVPPQEAVSALVKGSSTLVFGAIFGGLVFRDIRCVFLIVIVGALGLLASWRSTTERVIICNADGFIVESGFFPWQRVGRFYRWSEIRAIRYYEASGSKAKGTRSTVRAVGHFAVATPSGEVFDQTSAYAGYDFKGLVARFAAQTPHLAYTWLPNEQVGTRPVIKRVGDYSMVTRT